MSLRTTLEIPNVFLSVVMEMKFFASNYAVDAVKNRIQLGNGSSRGNVVVKGAQ